MSIPKKVGDMLDAWKSFALATADPDGTPNVVPMMQMWRFADDVLVIGDMFMNQTRENVRNNGKAGIAIWDDRTRESYKLKGQATYDTEGEAYEFCLKKFREKKPKARFLGAVVFKIDTIHDTASGPDAGKRIWLAAR